MSIKSRIKLFLFRKQWREKNKHNETYPVSLFSDELVTVGNNTYGELYVSMYNNSNRLVIGNYCSIGPNVVFLLSADHYTNHFMTYPFKVKYGLAECEGVSKGDIIVGDDVWLGFGAIILSGVEIGQGAIVAAGAVVTKNVPPYAIVGGNPAHILKYRFKQELVDELAKIHFKQIDEFKIIEGVEMLYKELESKNDLEELINHFKLQDKSVNNDERS